MHMIYEGGYTVCMHACPSVHAYLKMEGFFSPLTCCFLRRQNRLSGKYFKIPLLIIYGSADCMYPFKTCEGESRRTQGREEAEHKLSCLQI